MTRVPKTGKVAASVKPQSGSDILREMDSEVVTIDGRQVSMREAELELRYRHSLAGNLDASMELQRIRDASRSEEPPGKFGYLVVPEPTSLEEFEKMVAEQQAPFRNRNYGNGEF